MNLLQSTAVVTILLTVVEGQICKWGAPFGCPDKDEVSHRSLNEMELNPELSDTFHSPRDPENSDVDITEYAQRDPMDVEIKRSRRESPYRFEDIKNYLNNLYQ
ncbi:uncharacterized protein LOC111327149 [Stylophora pistillata]|uniref:Uncharacterized protein n=1 Tax=Stylophora pistillata TaxID=50429 RepID=A0A2B4SAT7_STYPI|nr:uncharacterized protein LOC111327149 [Stylophora pistillata]PFX27784.1 hypothetical protein AWC38_SpisGene7505 [Stylophora pistillata]